MTDPRTPAFSLQPPVRLRPGWRFLGRLGHRRVIAPLREGHYLVMEALSVIAFPAAIQDCPLNRLDDFTLQSFSGKGSNAR
jgi:hypothetical protein